MLPILQQLELFGNWRQGIRFAGRRRSLEPLSKVQPFLVICVAYRCLKQGLILTNTSSIPQHKVRERAGTN